jgi:hypothetical protein
MAGWQLNGIPPGASPNNQFTPALVPTGNGSVAILWREDQPAGSTVLGSELSGLGVLTWAQQPVLGTSGTFVWDGPGTTASDGAGGEISVGNVHTSGNWDIVAQRIDIHGNQLWGPDGVLVCAAVGDQVNPKVIADGVGGAICVWDDRRNGPLGDIYAQRMNASGTMLWTNNGVAACADPAAQALGSCLSDNAGGVVLAWDDGRNGNTDIYVQRISGSGTVLWAPNGNPFVVTPANEMFGQIVASGINGAIVTWVIATSLSPTWPPNMGDHYDVYTRRLDFGGIPDWPANVPVCIADGSRLPRAAVSDGAGGTIIALYDNRYGNTDLFLSRIDRFGNRTWGAGGIPLCTTVGEQLEPCMAADGAGGVIAAWSDQRGRTGADIYAGHVDALGNALWTPNGIPVCTALNNQSNPDMVADEVGGVVIAWEDSRNGNSLVFAQRLDAATGEWGNPNATGVGDTPAIPDGLIVRQNYPNPFGLSTDVAIELPEASDVSIEVYDVGGRRVNALALGSVAAGWRQVRVPGRDHDGRALASGVYFYRVSALGKTITRKMVIAR